MRLLSRFHPAVTPAVIRLYVHRWDVPASQHILKAIPQTQNNQRVESGSPHHPSGVPRGQNQYAALPLDIKIVSTPPDVEDQVQIRPAAIGLHVGFIHVQRAKIGRVPPVPTQPFSISGA